MRRKGISDKIYYRVNELCRKRDKLRSAIIGNNADAVSHVVIEFKQLDDELTVLEIQLRNLQASGIISRDISKTCESVGAIWESTYPPNAIILRICYSTRL